MHGTFLELHASLIEGRNAETIATESIRGYSEYIAALFDNFD